jgi:hypothetical protein
VLNTKKENKIKKEKMEKIVKKSSREISKSLIKYHMELLIEQKVLSF